MSENYAHLDLTNRIIGAAIEVSNTLGTGFLEKVYQRALAHELREQNVGVHEEAVVDVFYRGFKVGDYRADLLVDQTVIVEIKAAKAFDAIHKAQILNYLRATGLTVELLLNFGTPQLGIKRVVRSQR